MSTTNWAELLISVLALIVMVLAAIADTVVGLLGRQRLRQLVEEGRGWQRTVRSLLEPGRSLSAALTTLQVVAVTIAATLLTSLAWNELGSFQRLIPLLVVVGIYLVCGRGLPRALAASKPARSAAILIRVAHLLSSLAAPLIAIVGASTWLFARLLPRRSTDAAASGTEEELLTIALESRDDGVIEEEEREMIDAILHLEEISVRDIMVPRIDIVAVDSTATATDILQTIIRAGHSRIPVFQESIDQILGVLYAKDLLPFVLDEPEHVSVVGLLRPAYIVPESKRIDDLLKELRRQRIHIAIIADEYGGTAGLVTIEDILEEIVGEIQDEYDTEQPLLEIISDAELIADGRLPVEEAGEVLHLELTHDEDDDFGTLGGFVQKHLGRLPRDGDEFDAEGVHVEVLKVERHRIRRVRLLKQVLPVASVPSTDVHETADGPAESPFLANGSRSK